MTPLYLNIVLDVKFLCHELLHQGFSAVLFLLLIFMLRHIHDFQVISTTLSICCKKVILITVHPPSSRKQRAVSDLFFHARKMFILQRPDISVPQGAWNDIAVLWHLTINLESISKQVSGETY